MFCFIHTIKWRLLSVCVAVTLDCPSWQPCDGGEISVQFYQVTRLHNRKRSVLHSSSRETILLLNYYTWEETLHETEYTWCFAKLWMGQWRWQQMQNVKYCKSNLAASDGDLNPEGNQPFCEAEHPATNVSFAARRWGRGRGWGGRHTKREIAAAYKLQLMRWAPGRGSLRCENITPVLQRCITHP
jgi:hypothetical protein